MINKQAEELNTIIKQENVTVYELLSEKGRGIFFPKTGILMQGAQAKGKSINATVGIALEEDGSPLCLSMISDMLRLEKSEAFTYASSPGVPELRAKWKEMILAKNPGITGNISLPVVTNALSHGLFVASYLFVDSEVIAAEPFWGNYNLICRNGFGASILTFPIFKDRAFNVREMESLLNAGVDKKVLILNFPNNPTGYTPTIGEVDTLIRSIEKAADSGRKIAVICDDAYFGLVYEEGVYRESVFSRLSGLHRNVLAVKVDGATKEDYAWGFRTGFITYGIKDGNPALYGALEAKTAGAVRGTISSSSHPSQSLLLHAYNSSQYAAEKAEKYNLLKARYDKIKEVLGTYGTEYFEPLPCNSGYFLCLELKNADAEKVRTILLEKYDTGVIAINGLIRIAFSSTPLADIETLVENIYRACKEVC